MTDLLEVTGLRTGFHTHGGVIRAVDGVDFSIPKGGALGVVGESGSGKSVTALSVMRLIDPPGRLESSSSILFEGRDLAALSEEEMAKIRGNEISMIFQEPMTSLNPVFTVGEQIAESVRLHQNVGNKEADARAVEMMRLVGIPSAEKRVNDYPHQMSGGMRQRVMIGMALSCNPKLLIADEPTTALDVTVQAQILELMKELREKLGMAIRGMVPSPLDWPQGCRFAPRCDYAFERCATELPPLLDVGAQEAACWLCEKGPREVQAIAVPS